MTPEEIFCANGSNEVLQCLMLAYGGPGRKALVFEPTYALHSHISRLTGTQVVEGGRDEAFCIDADDAVIEYARRVMADGPCMPGATSPHDPVSGTA